jgi:hypothetical protein
MQNLCALLTPRLRCRAAGWYLRRHRVSDSFMTACPAVRFFDGWYYVATTTSGSCPAAGWSNSSAGVLCVILLRSKTLKFGSWVKGNGGDPIVFPGADDRKVVPQWKPTAAEQAAIFGHAP